MSVTHVYERADNAARNVDPMMLAMALDHIAKSAARSHSQTRRIRWIQTRAEFALAGREYKDVEVDLPKHIEVTAEKLNNKLRHWRLIARKLLGAALDAEAVLAERPDDEMAQAALAGLRESITWVQETIALEAERVAQQAAPTVVPVAVQREAVAA